MKWEKEVEGVMQQNNLTPEDALNWQKLRSVTGNQ